MNRVLPVFITALLFCAATAVAGDTNRAPTAVSPEQVALSTTLYKTGLDLQKKQNDLDGAIAKYEEALRVNPANADCLNHYAWFLAVEAPAERKKIDRGIELGLLAVKASDGKRPDILDTLAEAYFQKGDFAQAVETGRQAVRAQQESGSPKYKDYLQTQQIKFEAAGKEKK